MSDDNPKQDSSVIDDMMDDISKGVRPLQDYAEKGDIKVQPGVQPPTDPNPKPEPEKKPVPEKKPEPEPSPDPDPNPEPEPEPDDELLDDDEEPELTPEERILAQQREIGRQGNEIGELRKQLERLQGEASESQTKAEAAKTQERIAEIRSKWGPVVDDLMEVLRQEIAPIREQQGITLLRQRYPDFDAVRPKMDEIFAAHPALAKAAESDPAVVDMVYKQAMEGKAAVEKKEEGQKAVARQKKVDGQKKDAFVEKPSPKEGPPPKMTQKEYDDGLVDHIISLPASY